MSERIAMRMAEAPRGESSGFPEQLAQHVLQDAAVLVVVELDERIDAREHLEALDLAVRRRRRDAEPLARREILGDAAQRKDLFARQSERLARFAVQVLKRNDTH